MCSSCAPDSVLPPAAAPIHLGPPQETHGGLLPNSGGARAGQSPALRHPQLCSMNKVMALVCNWGEPERVPSQPLLWNLHGPTVQPDACTEHLGTIADGLVPRLSKNKSDV